MNNYDFIKEFIEGEREYNAYCHLGYKGNELYNYSAKLLEVDRQNKTAKFNTRKYSRTTTKIQNDIASILNRENYKVETYEDENHCSWWNCGYMGAEHWTCKEVKNW